MGRSALLVMLAAPVRRRRRKAPSCSAATEKDWGQAVADGDGNLDLVFAAGHPDALPPEQYSEVIYVLFGHGDGTFARAATYPVAQYAGAVAAIADFNGDGIPDIATATSATWGRCSASHRRTRRRPCSTALRPAL
ncbi:MAG: VCBS repeat-containing protein [Bryobacteraceae bacterium]|jgi:hypothetical protein